MALKQGKLILPRFWGPESEVELSAGPPWSPQGAFRLWVLHSRCWSRGPFPAVCQVPPSLRRSLVTGSRAQLDNLRWSFGLKILDYTC